MWSGICQIRRAGIEASSGRAQLDLKADDGTFDWTWFLSRNGIDREILATALAAISSNKSMLCDINATTTNSEVSRFLIIK
jgi:hypothetical protein